MTGTPYRRFWVGASFLLVLFGVYYLSTTIESTPTLTTDLAQFEALGTTVAEDFGSYPLVSLNEDYTLTDTLKDGVTITTNTQSTTTLTAPDTTTSLSLQFPEDLTEPLAITLPNNRTFTVTHEVDETYTSTFLTKRPLAIPEAEDTTEADPSYLKYTSTDSRIHTYYAYQKDQAKGYRNLKHWTIFTDGEGRETRRYRFSNAHLSTTERGEVEVRYIPNQTAPEPGVSDDLWARAQAVLARDALENITNTPADLTIPAPFTIDAQGTYATHQWEVAPVSAIDPADTSGDYYLTVSFEVPLLGYPIALDPTLQFTAPGVSNSGDVITGEAQENFFGASMATGDFNADGSTDLAVGASGYDVGSDTNEGRIYIFWSSDRPAEAVEADVIINGETSGDSFGNSLAVGDVNDDGSTDIIVGAESYGADQGRNFDWRSYRKSIWQ
jgi:hypothetical protein